jgi:methionyl-tRNA formyltransferase
MRFVFVGQNLIAGATLDALLAAGRRPQLVVTRADSAYPNQVMDTCRREDLPVLVSTDLNRDDAFGRAMTELAPDLALCCGWGNIIRKPLLDLPRRGCVNFHPSYLPAYRGSYPIEWQLINGEAYGGCTSHFMVERVDAGRIILQEHVPIAPTEDGESMRVTYAAVMGRLAVATLQLLEREPEFVGVEQDERLASWCPRRPESREIDWNRPAAEIYNLIRGLSPLPCAVLRRGGDEARIATVAITEMATWDGDVGSVVALPDGRIVVGAADRFVEVRALRIDDRIVRDVRALLMAGKQGDRSEAMQ